MSNINYTGINTNFPIAGQDNDTQVFKDNWLLIQTGLNTAKTEITALEDNSAVVNADNDFGSNKISKAVLINSSFAFSDLVDSASSTREIDFTQGFYQKLSVSATLEIKFTQFPGQAEALETVSGGVGKVTLELYNGSGDPSVTVTFAKEAGTNYRTNGITQFEDSTNYPQIVLSSTTEPVIVEVWQHTSDIIFLRNIGLFTDPTA